MNEKNPVSPELDNRELAALLKDYADKLGGQDPDLARILLQAARRIASIEVPPSSKEEVEDEKKNEAAAEPKEAKIILKPLKIRAVRRIFGKRLGSMGQATDFLYYSSEHEGDIGPSQNRYGDPIHIIHQNMAHIGQTILRRNQEINRDNPPSGFYVNWSSEKKRLNVISVQRLRESFGLAEGQDRPTHYANRPYLHKECCCLGNGKEVINFLKKGYSVFPYFFFDDKRFNFTEQLKKKAVTLEQASVSEIDGRPGNFWSDSHLAITEYLPFIAKVLSAISQGKNVLISASHPIDRNPIDTHSKILFFQLIQQLYLATGDKLLSFVSSPVFETGYTNVTFREPSERRLRNDSRWPHIEVESRGLQLTSHEQQIVSALDNLFMGDMPWIEAHQLWLEKVGAQVLKVN